MIDMADLKISELPLSTVGANDFIPISRSTSNYKLNLANSITSAGSEGGQVTDPGKLGKYNANGALGAKQFQFYSDYGQPAGTILVSSNTEDVNFAYLPTTEAAVIATTEDVTTATFGMVYSQDAFNEPDLLIKSTTDGREVGVTNWQAFNGALAGYLDAEDTVTFSATAGGEISRAIHGTAHGVGSVGVFGENSDNGAGIGVHAISSALSGIALVAEQAHVGAVALQMRNNLGFYVNQRYEGESNKSVVWPELNGTVALTTGSQTFRQKTLGTGCVVQEVIRFSLPPDETTALTAGVAKYRFRMPYAMTLTSARMSLNTAPAGAAFIVDINANPLFGGGSGSIFINRLSIDATEKTSVTAATGFSLSSSSLVDDAEISIDIDQVGSINAGAGAKISLYGTRVLS